MPFYPTYEEWKHKNEYNSKPKHVTFYPTYEEWKLDRFGIDVNFTEAFYPTYEEWKLGIGDEQVQNLALFILPMRNGNNPAITFTSQNLIAFYPTYEEWKRTKL